MVNINDIFHKTKNNLGYKQYCQKFSPYLSQLIDKHDIWLHENAHKNFEKILEAFREVLSISLCDTPQSELMSLMRIVKARSSLVIALYDVMLDTDVTEVTKMLSQVADLLIQIAFKAGCIEWIKRGKLPIQMNHIEDGSGLIVVGMGKLGAFELNFSSDIDISVFFDPEAVPHADDHDLYDGYVRATKSAVRLLSERTSEGYVYRVDLRLRPDPSSTKVAVPIKVAEYYYERSGQNWERAAWIKGRFIAGDPVSWVKLKNILRPFIWRRNLDYATISDIHSIKRQIHSHYGHDEIKVYGHDVKLGKGGIREIELFVQTQQLIGGGRDMRLREAGTLDILNILTEKKWISESIKNDLIPAYKLFRKVEHRLQMINDAQTHQIPTDSLECERLAEFSDFRAIKTFVSTMTNAMICVNEAYKGLFENQPQLATQQGSLVFTGTDPDPDTIRHLTQMGFTDAKRVIDMISGWHKGHYRAIRSAKARELLTELTPNLLTQLAKTSEPDMALIRIDHFLSGLPSGISFFSYLMNSPALMDLLIDVMAYAPNLADYLSHYPSTFDAMTDVSFFNPPLYEQDFEQELYFQIRPNQSHDRLINIIRRFCREQKFRIGVLVLRNLMTASQASYAFTALARVCIRHVVYNCEKELRQKLGLPYSKCDHNSICVVGMGSLGADEMNNASDLDLIMVYQGDFQVDVEHEVHIDAQTYYAKLGKRILTALTISTEEGALYEVDMRLRPSGNSGPLVIHFDRFLEYQKSEAHTWEKCALTKAIPLTGSEELQKNIKDAIKQSLKNNTNLSKIKDDIHAMRLKLLETRPPKNTWDIKLVKGGLFDINFIIQYLLFSHSDTLEVASPRTVANLEMLYQKSLLSKEDYHSLLSAWDIYQDILHIFAIAKIDLSDIAAISQRIKRRLCNFLEIDSFDQSIQVLDTISCCVTKVYNTVFSVEL